MNRLYEKYTEMHYEGEKFKKVQIQTSGVSFIVRTRMTELIEIVKNVCEQRGVTLEQCDDELIYKFRFHGKNAIYRGAVELVEQPAGMFVYTRWPLKIPASAIRRVSEFILKINCILAFGHLDLIRDPDSVAYRTAVVWGDAPVHSEIIRHIPCGNWATADQYFPMFLEVIEQQKELQEIVHKPDGSLAFILIRQALTDGASFNENYRQSVN